MPSTSGRNILPDVLAQRIAEQQGATVQTGRGASATARTEAKKKTSFWAKMEDPVGYIPGPDFDALRRATGPIYLVEDVHNTGESWMAMRRLLEDNGIPVAGVATLTATELRVTSPRDIERLSEKIATLTDTPLDETTELVYGLFHDSYKQWFNKAERIATGDARQAVRLLDAARAHARARATQRNNEAANEGRVQGQGNQDTLAPSYEQLSLFAASRLEESALQGYLDLPNVNVPASKQPTAKRAIRAAAASTEPYELPASGGSVGNAGKLDALRERAQRTWRGLMDQDVDALKEAFRESDSFSSLLHDFISRGIPRFDIRGAIIENAADFAAFNLAVRTPYFESLKIAILDAANQVVHSQIVHVGGLNEAIADPKVIAGIIATARMLNPKSKLTGWIIAHNHPSGDPSPSDADRRVTRRLLAMGENIGLPLIDHVVTNGERYFSFRESGMIFSSIDDSIDQRPTRSSKPKLPTLPTPTAPFQDNVADYEALPSGSLKTSIFLNAPDKTLPYLQTLRTADPDHYHVLYLDTRLALRAVERIPTSVTLPQLFQRIVLGSAREGGYAFTLGFPATLETTNVVQEDQSAAAAPTTQQRQIVRRLREQSQSIGLVFADAMTHSQERHFSFSEYGLMEEPGALASAPRRARESMNFDPPFKAPFGDILSYSWASKPIGGMQSQRVSDWNNAITNGQTGRDIVHLFKVRKPDGIHTVSLETALGLLSNQDRNRLTSIIRSKQKEIEDENAGQMRLFASSRLPLSRALTPTTLGASAAFFRPRIQNPASSNQPSGQGLTALIPVTPRLLSRAYQSALRGQSSGWLPIRTVWDQFHAQNPAVTPAAFMRSVKEGDDAGTVLLSPPESAATVEAAGPFKLRNASGIMSTDMMVPLASSSRITDPPFDTAERKALENTRIHAIDTYLHGKRRPIANTPPADQARSSRAQLQTLLQHVRRSQRPGGPPAGDEQTRRAAARRLDKATLIDWARNAGVLLTEYPDRYPLNSPQDKGGSEHHVFHDASNRWVKITKGDGSYFGYQPLDEGKDDEWMISKDPADLLSYLEKLALHNLVFHDDIILHGVVSDPLGKVALIISQPHYKGTFAGVYTSIKPAMEAAGFVRVEPPSARREEPSAYYHPSDNVAVIDLHSENAILEDNGTFLRVFDNIMLQPTGALRATFERLAAERSPLAASTRSPSTRSIPPTTSAVAAAAAQTDPNPSDAQKRAGLHGLRISIENPAGSVRSGTDANGKPWSIVMPHHYGRILGTVGRDKDHVDFFLGPNPDSQQVLIINQRKVSSSPSLPLSKSGFDEHKIMLGFNSPADAARGYMASYTKGWKGLGSAVPTTTAVLKQWLTHHDTTQPVTKDAIEKLAKTVPLPQSAHDKPAVTPVNPVNPVPLPTSNRLGTAITSSSTSLPIKPDMDNYSFNGAPSEEGG
jgi:DNA repair protein RadC